MPATPTSFEDRPADRRTQILRAARRVVSENGFREAQMTAIAAVAGIAVGTIYRYFPSRADLMAEIVDTVSRREVEVLAGIAVSDGPPSRRLEDAVRTFAGRAFRNRRLAYALIAEPAETEVNAVRLRYNRMIARIFEGIIREGQRTGGFRNLDVPAAAACIVGAMMQGLVGPLAPEAAADPDLAPVLADEIAAFCLHAVLTREPDHARRSRPDDAADPRGDEPAAGLRGVQRVRR